MKYSFKTLKKIAPEVMDKIIKFAVARYWDNTQWREKTWDRLSLESIARKHFKEYVEWADSADKENTLPLDNATN